MTPDPTPDMRAARIAELSTGFALDELTDEQLRELQVLLADPHLGKAAAQTAWDTLHSVTDLRAARSTGLQDAVRQRLTPEHRPHRGRHLPWWSAGAVVAVILGLVAWQVSAHPSARPLETPPIASPPASAVVDPQQIDLLSGSSRTLSWPDGSHAILTGPGNARNRPAGLMLTQGQADVTVPATSSGWTIGLPDGDAQASPDSHLLVEVEADLSCIGVARGALTDGHGQITDAQTCRIGSIGIPWTTTAWNHLPETVPLPGASRWQLTLATTTDSTGSVTLTWPDGSLSAGPDAVQVSTAGRTVRALRPAAGRQIELEAWPWGFAVRLQGETLIHHRTPPTIIQCRTTGALPLVVSLRSGPPGNDDGHR